MIDIYIYTLYVKNNTKSNILLLNYFQSVTSMMWNIHSSLQKLHLSQPGFALEGLTYIKTSNPCSA